MDEFNLNQFEINCINYKKNAVDNLIELLNHLDINHGKWPKIKSNINLSNLKNDIVENYIIIRIVECLFLLFTSNDLSFTLTQTIKLFSLQRWLAILFGASVLKNADHIINVITDKKNNRTEIKKNKLLVVLLLYFPDSYLDLSINELWEINKEITLLWCFSILSSRTLLTEEALHKRESILEFLSSKTEEEFNLEYVPQSILHDVYMHCSYAYTNKKHYIKKIINKIIITILNKNNINNVTAFNKSNNKKIFVIVEWFTSPHSIYRTHSKTIEGLKEKFEVIGIGYNEMVDRNSIQSFHKYISIPKVSLPNQIALIKQLAFQENPILIYMPSIGMFPLTIWLSNIRICKYQVIGLGHPATTYSQYIDYVIVEEDYIGDENVFSEKLLRLPKNGMPYRYPQDYSKDIKTKKNKTNKKTIEIAICSTTMKVNYLFLLACNKIQIRANKKLTFNFLIGNSRGITNHYLQNIFKSILDCEFNIYGQQSYKEYFSAILKSDFFINPFPFGNTNGLVDAILAQKIGICKTGLEVHEHIDEGLFKRVGFPDWTITRTIEEYINAVNKMVTAYSSFANNEIENHLTKLHQNVLNGDTTIFANILCELVNEK